MAAVRDEERLDVFRGGDLLVVLFDDLEPVCGDTVNFQVGGARTGVVEAQGDRGSLHLLPELVPAHLAAAIVELDDGAVVVGVAPAVPVGAEDEVFTVGVGPALIGIGDADVPVVPVVRTGTEVLELEEQLLAARDGEVLAEFSPPAGRVVFCADDGDGDVDLLVIVALAGFFLRLIGGNLLG